MRDILKDITANLLWMYFPVIAIYFSLSLSGKEAGFLNGPEIAFVACVMFGSSVQKLSEISKPDIWAYRLASIAGFAMSLILAILVSYHKYTDFALIHDVSFATKIQAGLALSAITLSLLTTRLEYKAKRTGSASHPYLS